MNSGFMPKWKRWLHKIPFSTIICPAGNWHWRWQKLYRCCDYNDHPIYFYDKGIWIELKVRK